MNTDEHRFGGKVKTPFPRRVGARGLQETAETAETAMLCRPGALTGRVFNQEPSRNDVAGKPQMNTDEHRFEGKVSFTIAQSASRKGDASTPESQDRKIDDRNMPMNRFPIFLHQPSTLNHQPSTSHGLESAQAASACAPGDYSGAEACVAPGTELGVGPIGGVRLSSKLRGQKLK